ncbi:MAG: hypothetical protein Q9221_007486 [Calogaya cf. arnoldii]
MPTNFFSLPREIRDQIYGLVLLHQEPLDPFNGWRQQQHTPGLLRANKIVHDEASSLFYARSCIDITHGNNEDVASFFRQIGRGNANHIRHIYLDFLDFQCLRLNNVALTHASAGILATIQSNCANLYTLTTERDDTDTIEFELDSRGDPKVVTEALDLVSSHFRAIASLQKIIVEVFEDGPNDFGLNDHIRKEMERHGWTINTAKRRTSDEIF